MPRHSPYALSSLTYFHRFFVLKLFGFVTNEIKYLNILFLVYLIFHLYIFQCAYLLTNIIVNFGGLKWNRTIDLTLIRRAL